MAVLDEPMRKVNKNEYKGIWVFAEQLEGKITNTTLELLTKARELNEKLEDSYIGAILLGHNVQDSEIDKLFQYGAQKVFYANSEYLEHYRNLPYVKIISEALDKYKPEIVLLGATSVGRALASRVATRLQTGLTADCTELDIDSSRNLLQIRPAFGGNIIATIKCDDRRPQMATVRPKVFAMQPLEKYTRGEIIELGVEISEADLGTIVKKIIREAKKEKGLEESDVIVAAGRGIGKPANLKLVHELALLLDGAVGATRAIVDAGWIGQEHQVGQTGKTVRPKIYFAFGISGAIQHLAGMRNSDVIIAVNKDPNAPIFSVAHYKIVGDAIPVLKSLIKNVREAIKE